MKIGKQLKNLRLAAGLTQEELGKRVNLSRANISKYESDDVEPNLTTLNMFAKIFGVSVDTLLGLDDDSNPPNNKESSQNEKAQEVYDSLKSVGIDLETISEKEYRRLLLFIDKNRDLILERSVFNDGN